MEVWKGVEHPITDYGQAIADGSETTGLVWLAPDDALRAQAAGQVAMALASYYAGYNLAQEGIAQVVEVWLISPLMPPRPPQWYILRELADFCPRLDAVGAYAAMAGRVWLSEISISVSQLYFMTNNAFSQPQ